MPIAFISDLHLQDARPELTHLFLNFLKKQAGQVEALYILGDLFEAWIGDDDASPFHQHILAALRTFAHSSSKLYFMPGNRDFLIGRHFAKQASCILLKDPSVIFLFGERVLLLHGDSLCTQDKKHMAFRKKSRRFLTKKIFLLKSLETRRKIAAEIRKKSKAHTEGLADEIMDVTQNEVRQLLHRYKVNTLIHGHTHRPSIEYFRYQGEWACRIVLSDWEHTTHALICDENSKRLENDI